MCKWAIIIYTPRVAYLFYDQWRGWRPLWFSEQLTLPRMTHHAWLEWNC